jgi:hypothetical protein
MGFGKGGKHRRKAKWPAPGDCKSQRKQKIVAAAERKARAMELEAPEAEDATNLAEVVAAMEEDLAGALESEAEAASMESEAAAVTAVPARAEARRSTSNEAVGDTENAIVCQPEVCHNNKRKQTMKEREEAGYVVIDQTKVRSYVTTVYFKRFKEPDESEWPQIAQKLCSEVGLNTNSIKDVFKKCRDGDPHPERQREGAGHPRKLAPKNAGLKAATIALGAGVPPSLATKICNDQNKATGITVSRNTVINTLKKDTNVTLVATQRRKTGSKDSGSAWAVARKVLATQYHERLQLGKQVRAGLIMPADCEVTPYYSDGILWVDENHIKQVIGGNGRTSSFSSRQYLIAMDPVTGSPKPLSQGGKMQVRKQRVVPKYPQEARACYGVAVPSWR